ncbi:TIGR00366 family protein [Cupriavidus basilensis]
MTAWCEKWYPDAYVFVGLTVVAVALGAMAIGASPGAVSVAFGSGFWSLIPFTMQMAMVAITGYVIASSPPMARLVERAAQLPRNGRSAVAYVAFISVVASLLHWAISLIFAGLLAKALARRTELRMDYRAAGAAAYLGIGATWAMGLSSSAGAAAGKPGKHSPEPAADHWGNSVQRDHLSVAEPGSDGGLARGLNADRILDRAGRVARQDCGRTGCRHRAS